GSLPGGNETWMRFIRGRISVKPIARAMKIPISAAGIQPCFMAPERDARKPPESRRMPTPAPESGGETLKTRSQERSCSVDEALRHQEDAVHSLPWPMKRARAPTRWTKRTAE